MMGQAKPPALLVRTLFSIWAQAEILDYLWIFSSTTVAGKYRADKIGRDDPFWARITVRGNCRSAGHGEEVVACGAVEFLALRLQ